MDLFIDAPADCVHGDDDLGVGHYLCYALGDTVQYGDNAVKQFD